jgi:hypothetical protein
MVNRMRVLLVIVLLLTILLTLWCAAGYFGAPAQQIETRAELSESQAAQRPLTDAEIAVHVSRVGRQGRNWGFAAALASGSVLATLASLIAASRKKPA